MKAYLIIIMTGVIMLFGCARFNKENIESLVQGTVTPDFEEVRIEFIKNFIERDEVGASVCVYYQGQKVVDLWGGYRDADRKIPWEKDTLSIVFSATKGLSSMALAKLHSEGLLDYEQRVSYYWKEFAQNGKEEVTVRQLLSHQAGLIITDEELTKEKVKDHNRLAEILARVKPAWVVGEHHGYHASTMGFYMSELLRRVDPKHRSLGQYFQEELVKPLGEEFYIGLPKSIPDDRLAKIELISPIGGLFNLHKMPEGLKKVFFNGSSFFSKSMYLYKDYDPKERESLEIENPAGNGIGTARAVAHLYSVFAEGGKELGLRSETVKEFLSVSKPPKKGNLDVVMNLEGEFGLAIAPYRMTNGAVMYGFHGAIGAYGLGDPVRRVGYGYIPNKMDYYGGVDDPRELSLRYAIYRCIDRIEKR